jgi:hypothetical protein
VNKIALFLIVSNTVGFAAEVKNCEKSISQHVLDMLNDEGEYPECYWDPPSNTLGVFLKNEDFYFIMYDNEAMTFCLRNERNSSTYYGCAMEDRRTGMKTSYCQTRKKASEIKNRLKNAK